MASEMAAQTVATATVAAMGRSGRLMLPCRLLGTGPDDRVIGVG